MGNEGASELSKSFYYLPKTLQILKLNLWYFFFIFFKHDLIKKIFLKKSANAIGNEGISKLGKSFSYLPKTLFNLFLNFGFLFIFFI